MPNYRGGDNSMGPAAAAAAHNIRKGDTPGQRNRDLRQRAILTGVQAMLTGVAGGLKAHEGNEYERKSGIMRKAIENASKVRDSHDKFMASTGNSAPFEAGFRDTTGPGEALSGQASGSHMGQMMDRSVGMGSTSPEPQSYLDQIKEIGDNGLAQDDVNRAAAGAPVTWGGGQHWTPAGQDDATQNSAIMGQDINASKGMMSRPETGMVNPFGGMRNSLRGQRF